MTSYGLSGGSTASALLVVVLFAYVLQTELTQVRPFTSRVTIRFTGRSMSNHRCNTDSRTSSCESSFCTFATIFMNSQYRSYIAHSSFTFVLPVHLLYLKYSTGTSPSTYLSSLWSVMQHQILTRQPGSSSSFPWLRYAAFVTLLTSGMTCPALLWYASVSLAPYVPNPSPSHN
jgi:hypothetical protein